MVEFRRLVQHNLTLYFLSQSWILKLFHNLKQYLIRIFIPKHLVNNLMAQRVPQLIQSIFIRPVAADTFQNDSTWIFLQRKLIELGNYSLSYSCTLILSEKFITELDDIISVGIAYQLIDVEVYYMQKVFLHLVGYLRLFWILFYLWYFFKHLLYYTHRVFVQSKGHEIL